MLTDRNNTLAADSAARPATRKRFLVVGLLFVTVAINYLNRSNLSIAAPGISSEFGLTPAAMGWILSAWGWAYAAFQMPGCCCPPPSWAPTSSTARR